MPITLQFKAGAQPPLQVDAGFTLAQASYGINAFYAFKFIPAVLSITSLKFDSKEFLLQSDQAVGGTLELIVATDKGKPYPQLTMSGFPNDTVTLSWPTSGGTKYQDLIAGQIVDLVGYSG
jgi:hypothetical protein